MLARAHSSYDTSRKAEGKCRGEIRIKRQIRGTLKYVALKKEIRAGLKLVVFFNFLAMRHIIRHTAGSLQKQPCHLPAETGVWPTTHACCQLRAYGAKT